MKKKSKNKIKIEINLIKIPKWEEEYRIRRLQELSLKTMKAKVDNNSKKGRP
jgi:hypothetical protein